MASITSAETVTRPEPFKKIATVANRDLELMEDIKAQLEAQHNIEFCTCFIDTNLSQSEFAKLFRAQNAALLLSKMTTDLQVNTRLFLAIQAAQIPTINSVRAMYILDTRRRTFLYLRKHCPEVSIPQFFLSVKETNHALAKGKKILVKRNAHNIPKDLRFLGVIEDEQELKTLLQEVRSEDIFMQEYLGPCQNTVYKVYFVGQAALALKSIKQKESAFTARNENDIQERYKLRIPLEENYRQMGRSLHLNAYGIDYIIGEDGHEYVVDVNDFPSYRGIDEALDLLCNFLIDHYLNPTGLNASRILAN